MSKSFSDNQNNITALLFEVRRPHCHLNPIPCIHDDDDNDNDSIDHRAESWLKELIEKFEVQVVAIGNGQGSREAELFLSNLIKHHAISSHIVPLTLCFSYTYLSVFISPLPSISLGKSYYFCGSFLCLKCIVILNR